MTRSPTCSAASERIEAVTTANVKDTFVKYFPMDRYTIVTLAPGEVVRGSWASVKSVYPTHADRIDVGGTKIEGIALDAAGRELRRRADRDAARRLPPARLDAIASVVADARTRRYGPGLGRHRHSRARCRRHRR